MLEILPSIRMNLWILPLCNESLQGVGDTNDCVDYGVRVPPYKMLLWRTLPRPCTNCTIHAIPLGPT